MVMAFQILTLMVPLPLWVDKSLSEKNVHQSVALKTPIMQEMCLEDCLQFVSNQVMPLM